MISPESTARWQEHNREFLALAIDDLHLRMEDGDPAEVREQRAALLAEMSHVPALLQLVDAFELDAFERDVVLLCFAAELDPRFRVDAPPVTMGYALEVLEHANWAALDAAQTLRGWGIVEVDRAPALADCALRLSDDVVRFLMGFDPHAGDTGLEHAPWPAAVVASQVALATELARAIGATSEVSGEAPAVELHGAAEEERVALAALCADALDAGLVTADVRDLPSPGPELDALLRTWSRCCRVTATILCITGADARDDDPAIRHRIDRALSRIRGAFFVSVSSPSTSEPARPLIRRRVERTTADERLEIWQACVAATLQRLGLGPAPELEPELGALAGDFRLTERVIQRVCVEAEAVLAARRPDEDDAQDAAAEAPPLAALLRRGCAGAVRARLDPLADRIALEAIADVALPEREARQMAELEISIRLADTVSAHWGIGRGRTIGVTALFAGPSGTGKTHAALALARRLGLDLYRVDLAGILSKYIGETEKNLGKIFDAAEIGGVILLFDEADALFGKRSEVKDSHDRYANLSTAYLLAKIERAPTPTILTTNLKDAIDPAFMRRLSFVIDFPFPAKEQREEIWRSIYPPATPVLKLEPDRLATVAVTGGTISNIARRGAFLAAAEPTAVEMRHLFEATRRELRKVGRDMSPEELTAWP